MLDLILRDGDGTPETVYIAGVGSHTTAEGRVVSSLDVGSWRPLAVGDCVVALDRDSRAEFLVDVVDVTVADDDVWYQLRHLADLDPAAEPTLDDTRTWLRPT